MSKVVLDASALLALVNQEGYQLNPRQVASVMGFDRLSPNALKTARPELVEGHHLGL